MGDKIKNAATKSWRTTAWGVFGAVLALGVALHAQLDGDPATIANWTEALSLAAVAFGLGAARDNAVSSEAAGVA